MVDLVNRIAEVAPPLSDDRLNGETVTPAPASGRDERGRFAPGNPGGPGRPPRASEALYVLAASEVVGLDRFRWIVEEQANRALKGDLAAAQWVAKLLLGASPPRLSEVLAGALRGGPHYAVADELRAQAAIGGPGSAARRDEAPALADTLGDPDPPEYQTGPPEPDLEDLAKIARRQALLDVLGGKDDWEELTGDE